jgi:hypothetical protein
MATLAAPYAVDVFVFQTVPPYPRRATMIDLLRQQIDECHDGLDKFGAVLDSHSKADDLAAAQAVAELGKLRLVLAKLAEKKYGALRSAK